MEIASIAQAKVLARIWADGLQPPVQENDGNKTLLALVRRGWLVPTGEEYKYPNGSTAIRHSLTTRGLAAAVAALQKIVN